MATNAKDIAIMAGIGVGIYVAFQLLDAGKKAKDALNSAGEAIGSGLYDFFHPDTVGETVYYTVTFPPRPIGDGQRHAVPSRSVNANGVFTLPQFFGAQRWQIVVGKDGFKYAART